MRIFQNKPEFTPITIILETREDAQTLLDLIDAVEDFSCNDGGEMRFRGFLKQSKTSTILTDLSDARTNMEIEF